MINWKSNILQVLIAGILATAAAIIYLNIYKEALGVNFAKIINPAAITGSCLFGCLLMAIGNAILQKFNKNSYIGDIKCNYFGTFIRQYYRPGSDVVTA